MKVSISVAELLAVLGRNVAQRSTVETVEHVLLVADDDGLQVVSTDYQVTLRERITEGVDVVEQGSATANPNLFKSALAGLCGDVEVSAAGGKVRVRQGHERSFVLPSLNAADFPLPDQFESTDLPLSAGELATAIDRLSYAIGKTDERKWMRGLIVTATAAYGASGHRMAALAWDTPLEIAPIVLPFESLAALKRVLGEEGVRLSLEGPGSRPVALRAVSDAVEMHVRLIGEMPPDMRRYLPDEEKLRGPIVIDSAAAAQWVGRLTPFAVSFGKLSRIALEVSDGDLLGSANETQDRLPIGGECELKLSMAGQYLAEMFRMAGGAPVEWLINEPFKSQMFKVVGRDDIHVITPMK